MFGSSRCVQSAWLVSMGLWGCGDSGSGGPEPGPEAGEESIKPSDSMHAAGECEQSKSTGECYTDALEALFDVTTCGGSALPSWWFERNKCYAMAYDEHGVEEKIACLAQSTWKWVECADAAACDSTKLGVCMSAHTNRVETCDLPFSSELTDALMMCAERFDDP